RFQMPSAGTTKFFDQVCGEVEFANEQIEDFVLLRSDGLPTYHLSVVADDVDMRISHVIRGADHLSNTPKQILLYQALGAAVPVFAHVPLILGPDRSRLSKRHGATAVSAYREQGILPEAMCNFLALLGWSPGDNRELLRMDELIAAFSLEGISRSAAVFNLDKLEWFNTEYMRLLTPEELEPRAAEELRKENCWNNAWEGAEKGWFLRTLDLLKPRLRSLKDLTGSFRAFFSDEYPWDPAAVEKFWSDARLAELLPLLAEELAKLETFNASQAEAALRRLAEREGVKAGVLINAARVALTGQGVAPSLFAIMELFGQQKTVARLRMALAHLPVRAG
ncbi:MAG: glutamate--tRNA ligase, partial [Acidobacteria bacterium]|nr:glutamate--tRNA ligase [Acidobacteriota bacterium]